MVCYVNFLSATSPDTMDGSPARSIVPNHQLHIAGEEGGSATMVAVILHVESLLGWSLGEDLGEMGRGRRHASRLDTHFTRWERLLWE